MARIKIDFEKGYLTEREVLTLKSRLNNSEDYREIMSGFFESAPDGGYALEAEQIEKGRAWLMNLWKTPRGVERKNNPFGYREQHVLENFKEIRLIDFYDAANYYQNQVGIRAYYPYYWVIGSDGSGFQYTVYGGECHILG